MVWLYRSPIPVGRRGVFHSLKWFLPAFASLWGGGGQHPVCFPPSQVPGPFLPSPLLLPKLFSSRGRILGRNSDKSLKSIPPCYSPSPLLTDFTTPPPLSWKLVCNVIIVLWKPQVWDYAQTPNEILLSLIRLLFLDSSKFRSFRWFAAPNTARYLGVLLLANTPMSPRCGGAFKGTVAWDGFLA